MPRKVLIITGSKNDRPRLDQALALFDKLGIPYSLNVFSCHRNLRELTNFLKRVRPQEFGAAMGVARSAANLPAVMAGYLKNKFIPVVGVGLSDKKLNGIDSLLSVNTIPKGTPLLNTGIDKIGLYNAALAIAVILSEDDKRLKDRLSKL